MQTATMKTMQVQEQRFETTRPPSLTLMKRIPPLQMAWMMMLCSRHDI